MGWMGMEVTRILQRTPEDFSDRMVMEERDWLEGESPVGMIGLTVPKVTERHPYDLECGEVGLAPLVSEGSLMAAVYYTRTSGKLALRCGFLARRVCVNLIADGQSKSF